ncbi:MAG TPA: ABC transporter permease [Syntrophorhabdaceae bacterium]|nr:ABC transporter permease [Syntrophorhabdaceae bacterium]
MTGRATFKLLALVPVLLGVSVITFSLMYMAPGNPADILMRAYEEAPAQESVQAFRSHFGLDDGPCTQYVKWLSRVLRGNLGVSFKTGESVQAKIIDRLPATLELAGGAFLFMVLVSISFGITGALCRGRLPDKGIHILTVLATSVPAFLLGLVLLYAFGVLLNVLPVTGRIGPGSFLLPVVTLGLAASCVYGRTLRAIIIDVIEQNYVKQAYAMGLSTRRIITGYIMKNAMLPLVTLYGMSMGHLLGGAVIVESIFSWPGVGKMALEAIMSRDYPVVLGYVLFMTVVFTMSSLAVDMAYRFLDPRVQEGIGYDPGGDGV